MNDVAAAAATRLIERKIQEAIDIRPAPDVAPPSLSDLVEEIRSQLKALDDKMSAGFKLAAQRIDSIEQRLDRIETFIHVPPGIGGSFEERPWRRVEPLLSS